MTVIRYRLNISFKLNKMNSFIVANEVNWGRAPLPRSKKKQPQQQLQQRFLTCLDI